MSEETEDAKFRAFMRRTVRQMRGLTWLALAIHVVIIGLRIHKGEWLQLGAAVVTTCVLIVAQRVFYRVRP